MRGSTAAATTNAGSNLVFAQHDNMLLSRSLAGRGAGENRSGAPIQGR
jgi:hypothetical protein